MSEPETETTPWSPPHLQPASCCCVHPDAWQCSRLRWNAYGSDDVDEPCGCYCHEQDPDMENEL